MSFYHLNPNRRGERLAQRLEQFDDYRVLRRLPRPDEMWCRSMPASDNVLKLAIVDCETTGLDPEKHKMIEFAVGTLSIDAEHGDVVDVTPPKSWLEDPAEDLSIEIEQLTHITSDMLIGKFFPDAAILKELRGANAIVAHNARFDYAFATKRFRTLADLPWCCSMSEIDWPALGWSGGARDRCVAHRCWFLSAGRPSRRGRCLGDDLPARVDGFRRPRHRRAYG